MISSSQAGFTVWFTGMAGSGKSTIAQGLSNRLKRLGKLPEVLDGAEAETMLGVGRAQTKDDRNAEARKLAWVCKMITRSGGMVLQSAIDSPYRETRDEARRQINRFVEVFVDCPTDVLIERDSSGMYKKALAGEIPHFTGVSDPYEEPLAPEVVVDSSAEAIDSSLDKIVTKLRELGYLDGSGSVAA